MLRPFCLCRSLCDAKIVLSKRVGGATSQRQRMARKEEKKKRDEKKTKRKKGALKGKKGKRRQVRGWRGRRASNNQRVNGAETNTPQTKKQPGFNWRTKQF